VFRPRVDVRQVRDAPWRVDRSRNLVDERDEGVRHDRAVELRDPDLPSPAADRVLEKGTALLLVAGVRRESRGVILEGEVGTHPHEVVDVAELGEPYDGLRHDD
jgi:hypothetical protein